MTPSEQLQAYAGFLGASAVGLGAMGAHALAKQLNARGMIEAWRTASLYQLFSSASLCGLAALAHSKQDDQEASASIIRAGNLITAGTLLFSGSIYMLCFPEQFPLPRKLLGPATPVGGLVMIGGWLVLGISSIKL